MTNHNIHQVEILCTGLDHPECLNFGEDGRLYAGGFAGQIYVMSKHDFGLRELGRTQGFIGGVASDGSNNVYACNGGKRCVERVDPNGKFSIFCNQVDGGPLIWPNYGSFGANGDYYFSDSGDYWKPNGRLICVGANGKVESIIGGNWHFPNGLAISPKDASVFMIESTAADILRVPISKDRKIGMPEIYAQLPGNVLDGLAFARNGNLYCSCYLPNRIYVIYPDRNIELLIEDTTGEILNQPTNVAFEPGGTRLFFSSLGASHIGALDVGEEGMTLFYPRL